MAESKLKTSVVVSVAMFAIVHISLLAFSYGTTANEMKSINEKLSGIATGLKTTNQIVLALKESDIRREIQQNYILERVIKLENLIGK